MEIFKNGVFLDLKDYKILEESVEELKNLKIELKKDDRAIIIKEEYFYQDIITSVSVSNKKDLKKDLKQILEQFDSCYVSRTLHNSLIGEINRELKVTQEKYQNKLFVNSKLNNINHDLMNKIERLKSRNWWQRLFNKKID